MSSSIAPSIPISSPAIPPTAPAVDSAIASPAPKGVAPSNAISTPTSIPTSTPTWTPERIEQLRSCVGSGMTCSQIAAAIGVSRNAVIGKIHRLGLSSGRPAGAGSRELPSARAAPAGTDAAPALAACLCSRTTRRDHVRRSGYQHASVLADRYRCAPVPLADRRSGIYEFFVLRQ